MVPVEVTDSNVLQGYGDKAEVDKRVLQLKEEIDSSPSDWEKEKLKERLAKLSTGVAAIKVTSHLLFS